MNFNEIKNHGNSIKKALIKVIHDDLDKADVAMFLRAAMADLDAIVEAARVETINRELDNANIAYRVKDAEGNTFTYAGLEGGFPVYRGVGGSKQLFDTNGLTVLQKYEA